MTSISAGGVTLFASTHDKKEGDFLVCWGQAATYGELGLGAGAVRFLALSFWPLLSNLLTLSFCSLNLPPSQLE